MRTILRKKSFSGALQFTLFISVLILLILGGLLLLNYSHNYFILQSRASLESTQLSNSGINLLLETKSKIPTNLLYGTLDTETQKLEFHTSSWGMFQKGTVTVTHRNKKKSKTVLIGSLSDQNEKTALYLEEKHRPLVLVGNAFVFGNAYLPKQGAIPGNIEQYSFYDRRLITGRINVSDTVLPKLNLQTRKMLMELSHGKLRTSKNLEANTSINEKKSNSFLKPTIYLSSDSDILLDKNEMTGNIIVTSGTRITVNRFSSLKDVILIAPNIIIEDGVSGNFQAIATKNIVVGKDCTLPYPSALIVIEEKKDSHLESKITIGKNSKIKGTICYLNSERKSNFATQIAIEENSIVNGEIYCEGNLEIKGKVYGSIFTQQFIVNSSSSTYINHILNGQIINDEKSKDFCGILIEKNKKGIAKWLY